MQTVQKAKKMKERTTVYLDEEKARAIRFLGYTVSGCLDRVLDAVIQDREKELIASLKNEIYERAELSQKLGCPRCGGTLKEERKWDGRTDPQIIKWCRCGWSEIRYPKPTFSDDDEDPQLTPENKKPEPHIQALCPKCGSPEYTKHAEYTERDLYTQEDLTYSILKCKSCNYLFINGFEKLDEEINKIFKERSPENMIESKEG